MKMLVAFLALACLCGSSSATFSLFPRQHFDPFAFHPWDMSLFQSPLSRPWCYLAGAETGISKVTNNKDKFEVSLDVHHFKPEEITVKNKENVITIEGKHEEKEDQHGYISRQFVRKYVLPKDVLMDQVKVQMSSDGVLQLGAPKKALPAPEGERILHITQTGVPAIKAEVKQEETKKEEKHQHHHHEH